MNRWHIYEYLKYGIEKSETEKIIREIERMDSREVKEGVIEYLLAQRIREVEANAQ